ncbi:MAG: adenylate/guanylate cyclase domain-containing protein [Chthoniobacteraceae bacterium]
MDRVRKSHDLARAWVFIVGTALLMILEISWVSWHTVEWHARDWMMRFGRLTPKNPQLVFLAIDQPSISLDGVYPDELAASPELQAIKASGWPWSRDIYAPIIDRLCAAGARVVALDILFPTPREGDEKLHDAIVRHSDQVVIGMSFVDNDREHGGSSILMVPAQTIISPDMGDKNLGLVNFWPDEDGIVRRVNFWKTANEANGIKSYPGEKAYPSLATRMLEKAGLPLSDSHVGKLMRFTEGVKERRAFDVNSLYEIFIPSIWNGPKYRGGAYFKDKLVVIGPEGDWSKDLLNTTFGLQAGPTMYLHAVNAAIHDEFINDVSDITCAIWIGVAGLAAWWVAIRTQRPLLRVAVLLGLMVLALWSGWMAYNSFLGLPAQAMAMFGVCLALDGTSVGWFVWEQFYEWRERQRTRRTLERYVSKNLVREILDNPQSYFNTLGGVRKPVAIMFTDLRGFTALSEHADSHQIVLQLNEYLSEMVQHVFNEQGTLDKFIGDAIMAEWGNLYSQGPARDVEQSVNAALKMSEGLKKLNVLWKERGVPCLAMGIGINYGEVIVGNIGSSTGIEKMDPTVIGDAVNLASRLEGLTKEYGLELVLGEQAGQLAMETFHVQEVDFVKVKGRSKPLAIYTVLGRKDAPFPPEQESYLKCFAEGLTAYRKMQFEHARVQFSKCLDLRPGNELAAIFEKRCEELLAAPPEADWDGVFVMHQK